MCSQGCQVGPQCASASGCVAGAVENGSPKSMWKTSRTSFTQGSPKPKNPRRPPTNPLRACEPRAYLEPQNVCRVYRHSGHTKKVGGRFFFDFAASRESSPGASDAVGEWSMGAMLGWIAWLSGPVHDDCKSRAVRCITHAAPGFIPGKAPRGWLVPSMTTSVVRSPSAGTARDPLVTASVGGVSPGW
jgi:hypothetical protein